MATLPFARDVKEVHTVLFLRTQPVDATDVSLFLPEDVLALLT